MFLFALVSVLCLWIGPALNIPLLAALLFLAGVGIAIAYISTTTGALASAPESKMGAATGLFFTIVWLSCALAVAISGTAIAMGSQSYLETHIAGEQMAFLQRAAQGVSPASLLPSPLKETALTAFAQGIHDNGIVLLIASLVGFVLSFCLVKKKGG